MSDYKLTWKTRNEKYGVYEILYIGKWFVGHVSYTGTQPKGSNQVICACSLPGIRKNLGYFESNEDAKKKLESAVKHWMNHLNDEVGE